MSEGIYKILKEANPTNIDDIGFQARLEGLEVRDCILVLEPQNKCSLQLKIRSEMTDTVLETILRKDNGAIDIDGSRIGNADTRSKCSMTALGQKSGWNSHKNREVVGGSRNGRFPTNLILKHGADCYCEGTKKVEGGTAHQDNKEISNQVYGGEWNPKGVSGTAGYTSEDGTEEVPNWICEPSCPVRILDTQRGNRPGFSGGGQRSSNRVYGDMPSGEPSQTYGDEGGASRFFKQVQSEDELDTYLKTLIRENTNE